MLMRSKLYIIKINIYEFENVYNKYKLEDVYKELENVYVELKEL